MEFTPTTIFTAMFVAGLAAAHFLQNNNAATSRDLADTGRWDEHGRYLPSPSDIVDLRATLVRAKKIPLDIVDEIFNFAEYWACSSNVMDYIEEHGDTMKVMGRSRCEDKFVVST